MSGFSWTLPAPPSTPSLPVATQSSGIIDHAQGALDRLPQQFQNQPNIEKLIRALCQPMQDFEDVAVDVLAHGTLKEAFGDDLTVLGKLVGQSRGLISDDDLFKRYIASRIITNRSTGTSSDLIKIIRLILNSPSTSVLVEARQMATVRVSLTDLPDPAIIPTLVSFLGDAKGQAIRLYVLFSVTEPTFRFDSGPGFDSGHLSSSSEA